MLIVELLAPSGTIVILHPLKPSVVDLTAMELNK
jgi:hypothetical protein